MNLNVQWQEQNPDLWVCFRFKDKPLFSFGHLLIATGDGDGDGDRRGVDACDVSAVQRALNV